MPNIRRGMMAAAGAAGGAVEYQLWAWGKNSAGSLGNGGAPYGTSSPVQIGDNFFGEIDFEDEGIIAIQDRIFTSGTGASAAVKGDGTLWTWGYNIQGKLGLGDTTNRSVPVQVGSLTDWRSVCGTGTAMCATKTDGTLWGWGKGDQPATYPECSGQDINVCSPVQIGSDTDWAGVLSCNMVSNKSVLGLKTNGIMYMWGNTVDPYFSQGGFNDTVIGSGKIYCRLPQRPGNDPEGGNTPDDKNYVTAGCARDNVWAIDNTGKLWTWGTNQFGTLGLGDTISKSSPVQVGSATDWIWVSGNYGNSLFAGKSNGEVWAAGRNDAAEFGLDAEGAYSSPIQVGGPGGWQSGGHGLSTGTTHFVTDANGDNTGGALWACGTGGEGVRGDGENSGIISSPVQIGTDTTWVALSKQGSISSHWKLAIKKAG